MPIVLISGNLNLLEPSGSVQVCKGIALHFFNASYTSTGHGTRAHVSCCPGFDVRISQLRSDADNPAHVRANTDCRLAYMPVQLRSFVFPFAVLRMKLFAVNKNKNNNNNNNNNNNPSRPVAYRRGVLGCSNPPPRNSEDTGGDHHRTTKKNRRLDFLL